MLLKPQNSWVLDETHKSLRAQSRPVVFPLTPEQRAVAEKMQAYIDASFDDKAEEYKIRPGIGMAAPQMGLNAQIIYVHLKEGDVEHRYLLGNPEIVGESLQMCYIEFGEGCLSVETENEMPVPRHFRVVVKALDLTTGAPVRIEASSLLAVCLQHEIDHLHGKLFYDRAQPVAQPDWIVIRR